MAGPVVVFDGECALCHGAVVWIIRRDRRGVIRFASSQSPVGRELLAKAGAGAAGPESVVLIDDLGVHIESAAVLRIATLLGWPWRAAAAAGWLPRGWMDGLYRIVARNRVRWFGRRDACIVPTPEVAARLLDAARTDAP
jgi:predicted DCC family thiol-disulfide oxidoreductase YuxK